MTRLSRIKLKDIKNIKLYDYKRLNDLIGGINCGELITIGARVGCGKTTLGLNILCDLVGSYNKVLFCSYEMSKQEIYNKIDKSYNLTPEALDDFYVEDDAKLMSIDWLEKMIIKHKFNVVCIDYIQIMNGKIRELTKQLKQLAIKYNVVIICLAQLNRKAHDNMPNLTMLKDSGTIEQDSDEVWFITEYKLIIAKNRKGRIGNIDIVFHKEKSWIEDTTSRVDSINLIGKQCIELLKSERTREQGKYILYNTIRYIDHGLFMEIGNALLDMIRHETPTKLDYVLTQLI